MDVPEKIFKAYDIRGIYPTEINEQNTRVIIAAIYAFFLNKLEKKKATVVLGSDMRVSSPSLSMVAKEVLMSAGADIIDVGLASTPTFYFAVFHYGFDSGIQITASHNPKEYNGIKFVLNSPSGLVKIGKSTGMEEVKEMVLENRASELSNEKGTFKQKDGVVDEEVNSALSMMGNPVISPFTVVADPANAMGGLYIDALFKKIPGRLIKMNFNLDGTFPVHQPDPLQAETLVDLQKRVVAQKADVGLAPDGDGDRLFFIAETGTVVPPTIITAIVVRELLGKHKGEKILFDIRYIFTPQKIVEENGGFCEITKVGHAFITEAMHKTGAIFAGESSAHYYFRETGNAESQLPVIIAVLSVMSREKKKLSELINELTRSYESGEINFSVTDKGTILERLKKKYSDGQLLELDGIAVSYPDWRFNLRSSNTEPLLRLNVEALTKERMEEKKSELIKLINPDV